MIQHFSTSFGLLALASAFFDASSSSVQSTTRANSSTSTSLSTSPSAVYPPPGLLDSLSSMKVREDIYQSDLSKHAARADIEEPALSWTNPVSPASGILVSMRSIESVYRNLLLPPPTPTPSGPILTVETVSSAPPAFILAGPTPLVTPPTPSFAPPPHVFISVTWLLIITFIILSTLTTIFGSLGNAFIVIMLINLICVLHLQPFQVDGHPDVSHPYPHPHHPHSALHATRDPLRRPIGGLRPGPVGKIPCGPVRGTIGTKGGQFLKGVHRKIGGLKPALPEGGDLYCDDWGNANFGRSLAGNATIREEGTEESGVLGRGLIAVPTPPSDDTEETITIYTTTTSTLMSHKRSVFISTPTEKAPYSTATETTTSDSLIGRSPFETPYYGQVGSPMKESSAVPPAVNIRTSFTYLLLLYLTGMLVCLLLGGSSYALSFLLISFALASIIAGAEGAAVPAPDYPHYDYGGRIGGLRPVKTIGSVAHHVVNRTGAKGGSSEEAGLKDLCGELFCHSWFNTNVSLPASLVAKEPIPTYVDLTKRLETVYITVPPTSGVIQIEGPQIIPITVVSTAFTEVVGETVTVDAVTERSTRTVDAVQQSRGTELLLAKTTRYISPGTVTTTLSNLMTELERGRVSTVTSGERTITVDAVLPASTSESFSPPSTETLWITTTVTASPSSASSSSLSSSSSSSVSSSTEVPEPSNTSASSQASHLNLNLYLSFVGTNLYCFLFLLIGLNIALTTSHPLAYLGSMGVLMVGGAMVLPMCASGSGLLRCNGMV